MEYSVAGAGEKLNVLHQGGRQCSFFFDGRSISVEWTTTLKKGIQFEDLRSAALQEPKPCLRRKKKKDMINRISLARVPSVQCPVLSSNHELVSIILFCLLARSSRKRQNVVRCVIFDDVTKLKHDTAEGILKFLGCHDKINFLIRVTSNNSLLKVRVRK